MIRGNESLETGRTPIVNGILWLTAVHMAVSLIVFAFWLAGGDDARIELFFQYQGSLFFVGFAGIELLLAWNAFRQFAPGEPLRGAWLLIVLAAFYRCVGYLFSKILNADTHLNPVYMLFGSQNASLYRAFEHFGLLISGPLSMAVLAAGLCLILRALRRIGILSRLRAVDFVLISVVLLFTLRQLWEIWGEIRMTSPPHDLYKMLLWPSDPLLCLLLLEAILIRRSAVQTGWGLLAKSWGAFSLAILFTSLGDIGQWATVNHNYIPWPYSSVTWYVWFLASAAFTLGPAYQVEACRRAYREATAGPSATSSISE